MPPDEGGNFALEGKPPLPPTEGPGGTGTGAGGTGTVPKPPPRTRPKSWTSSLFNAMSRQNHKSVNFQSVLEEQNQQQNNSQNSQSGGGSVSRNGSGSRLNMVSSCSPQKYSALGGGGGGQYNDDEALLPAVVASKISDQQYNRSDQYNVEEKLRIPQVQNVLATRGSRTPSPFRTIFKGMAKGTKGGERKAIEWFCVACRRRVHHNPCSVLRALH